ncbi:MAG: FkbM family methyltransferase [Nitrososphaerales archaeon]
MVQSFLRHLLRPFRPYYLPIVHKNLEPDLSPEVLNKYLTKNDVVIEAGANIDGLTMELAKHVRLVYSFEPHPYTYKILKSYTKKIPNVIPLNYGVAEENKKVVHKFAWDSLKSSSEFVLYPKKSKGNEITVELVKIDDYEFSEKPTAMILDCEGVEISALQGAKNALKSMHTVLVEAHKMPDGTDTTNEVRHFLSEYFDSIEDYEGTIGDPWLFATTNSSKDSGRT